MQAEVTEEENSKELTARESKIEKLSAENRELQKPRRSLAQQKLHDRANSELAKLDAHAIQFIRALLHHEQIEHHDLHRILTSGGMSDSQWASTISAFRGSQPLVVDATPTPLTPSERWSINVHYREVLLELLG